MSRPFTLGILSDIHYAGPGEQLRGNDYEWRAIPNPVLRTFVRLHRRHLWARYPLNRNHLLDQFIAQAAGCDFVVANGDYSCNTGYIGMSDDAALESALLCLVKLREKFSGKFQATFGDHELGKVSFVGGRGGMRLESWRRSKEQLRLEPFWKMELGKYILLGVVSSLIALPILEPDVLPEELEEWHRLRQEHLDEIRRAFSTLQSDQRVLLFCHDPSALPFLWREEIVRSKLPQIETTIIGHLHSNLILWQSRLLGGIPRINFLGHTARRMSSALNDARHWKAFKPRLCPALSGIELLKDGGYLTAALDLAAREPARIQFHPLNTD